MLKSYEALRKECIGLIRGLVGGSSINIAQVTTKTVSLRACCGFMSNPKEARKSAYHC